MRPIHRKFISPKVTYFPISIDWYYSGNLYCVDEYDHSTGIMVRTCEENVAVNKCEGECASSIYPSALNSVGFHKVQSFLPFQKEPFSASLLRNLECLKNEKVISESAFIRNVIVAAKVDIESVTLS